MDVLSTLNSFKFERTLNEEPEKKRITLLGTFPVSWSLTRPDGTETRGIEYTSKNLRAIIRIEKTAFAPELAKLFFHSESERPTIVTSVKLIQSTDIYSWLAGWLSPSEEHQRQGDVKIDIICPATDDHVWKYSPQKSTLVRETPELYASVVRPYINTFPPARTRWVTKILSGEAEQEAVLFSSSEFILLPDMKWDLHTISSLYLIAIARDPAIHSLRDLRLGHVPLLKSIRKEAYRVVQEKWGLPTGSLRMWIHYQPSYYHFHVHIANAGYEGPAFGMAVGQAHLLDDVISLLETTAASGIDILEHMTFTYGLGEQHGLYRPMIEAQGSLVK
ncbi:scavenger mRNA decapping enzyme [Guyanagaster necrorhizus]|uniref:Scavenger mRNA decapping enzyme n=1 Tax=Guyanagaster necrorhizus TaxID=856835 RepID=A0A9P8AQI1_9AGAR|nr:scavenger mRNA decapping enzyme [Guyanagaster necrorhizus MCA 3950]KAG7444378.1 scavenger mRNA decapping enzyme [Guyanagaster necrorhizus MCA 3950]